MLELVSQNYWWPGLSRYVAKFIMGCDTCNWTKTFPTQKVGKLIPNKVPDRHWQVISIDMIGELPDSNVSWYDLPSPSPPTSGHLRSLPPPLCPFHLHSAPTPKHTCCHGMTSLPLLCPPLATSNCLCLFCLHSTPTLMHTCAAHMTMLCPLSD